ncbi:MAG: DUF2752 domain-containing protein [Bacteroidota bacterium]
MVIVSKSYKFLPGFLFFAVLIVLYYLFDPVGQIWFPKCPFYLLTGYKCPGCGSQRAVHYLLHFNIADAFRQNALLVVSLPYITLAFLFDYAGLKVRWPEARKFLFGFNAILILLVIVISWWVIRNL